MLVLVSPTSSHIGEKNFSVAKSDKLQKYETKTAIICTLVLFLIIILLLIIIMVTI